MKSPTNPIRSIWYTDDDSDDHELFAEATKQIIPLAAIDFFINGNDLLAALQTGRLPDILFLDLVMPLKDGYECLKEIREDCGLAHLPIVAFSGLSAPAHINTAYSLGANLYYKKPSEFNDYVEGLKILFQFDWQNPSTTTSGQYFHNKYVTYDPLL